MSKRTEKPMKIRGKDGVKEFTDIFAAIQYQKTAAYGREWLNIPMTVRAYKRLHTPRS